MLHSRCVGCRRAFGGLHICCGSRVHSAQSGCSPEQVRCPSRCVACAAPHVCGMLLPLRRCCVGCLWATPETRATTQNHPWSAVTQHDRRCDGTLLAGRCDGAEEIAPVVEGKSHDDARARSAGPQGISARGCAAARHHRRARAAIRVRSAASAITCEIGLLDRALTRPYPCLREGLNRSSAPSRRAARARARRHDTRT